MTKLLTFFILIFALSGISAKAQANYYMAANGSDSNPGTLSQPWASVNHAGLVCGDTITAASGAYGHFVINTQPTCAGHNAVFVTCAVFDTCKIYGTDNQGGIVITASNWAVLGWEVSVPTGYSELGACFAVHPDGPPANLVHDVYFINDVANGCQANGFSGDNGVDYIAFVADIAYNGAQGSRYCQSGFNVYQPIATDTQPGTHIYLAQDFSWHNIDPSPCQGFQRSTDGEGFTFDTFNAEQSYNGNPTPQYPVYAQQAVMENLITVYNGAAGAGSFGSGNRLAHMMFRHITATQNFRDTNQITEFCGQIQSVGYSQYFAYNKNAFTTFTQNLSVAASANQPGCGGYLAYAYLEGNVDTTSFLYGNAGFSPVHQDIGFDGLLTGFQAGPSNLFGIDPGFVNPVEPPAPSCSGKASVIDCMSTVIANYKPTNAAILSGNYGYQPPSNTSVYDPLFPQWLCNVNIPSGLVTKNCAPAPNLGSTSTIN